MLLEKSGEITLERRKRWSQSKCPVVNVTGDGSSVQCYKEQYCIATWNVRTMNQVRLHVIKQKMARVNINILGTSKLKQTGMGEFNPHDHYIYYCGQESLKRNGLALIKNPKCNTLLQSQKWQNDVSFQGKPFSKTVIQVYSPTSNAEEATVEWFYEDLQDILELTPPKRGPFHYRRLKCKSRKSRNTWNNR